MGFLDSIRGAASTVFTKAQLAVPTTTSSPAPSPAGFSAASSFQGGRASSVEVPVARRIDRDVPMRLQGTSQAERLANLPRLTQIDGNQKSEQDRATCGVQCVVASMYVKNPAQLSKVADYLLTKQGANLDQWAKECGLDPKTVRADLAAIKAGTASPRQLSTLSQMLFRDTKHRTDAELAKLSPLQRAMALNLPAAGDGGLNRDSLQILTKDILKGECGVEAGPLRMSLRDVPDGGRHWVAQFDVATMRDIEEGAKNDCVVTFDPAPNPLGLAPTGVAINRGGADADQERARGAALEEIEIDANGVMTKKEPLPLPPIPDR